MRLATERSDSGGFQDTPKIGLLIPVSRETMSLKRTRFFCGS